MQQQDESKLNQIINLDYKNDNDIWLQSSETLRKLIGVFGMALPILLLIFTYTFIDQNRPLESISHYYYTRAGSVFTVILSFIAIFLIVYSGKKSIDFYISTFAGLFALCVVFFPTGNLSSICCDIKADYAVTFIEESSLGRLREIFHLISAAIFLLLLAYMSIFLFTKSNKTPLERGKKKILRNRIYRICGILIIISLVIMLAGFLKLIPSDFYDGNQITFWMETLAVESFGFAWLIKGNTMFTD